MNPNPQENIDDDQQPPGFETADRQANSEEKVVEEVRDNVDTTLDEENEKRRKKAVDMVSKFVPQQANSGLKEAIASSVIKNLNKYRDTNKKALSNEVKDDFLSELQQFLSERVYETDKLIGVSDDIASGIEAEIKQDGKETKLRSLQAEMKQAKQQIEDLDEDISAQEKILAGYNIPKKGEGGAVLEKRGEIEEEISRLRGEKQSAKTSVRDLENKIAATEQIAANIDKSKGKIRPETLMVHIHYQFLKYVAIHGSKDKKAIKPTEVVEMESDMYRQAMDLAAQDMSKHKLSNQDNVESSGFAVKKIWLRTFVDFVAQSEILNDFPEDKKDKAQETLKQLKGVDPDTEKGKKGLEKIVSHLATLLPAENREENLQKIVAKTIATLEGTMDRSKWQAGISRRNIEKVVKLNSGLRRAYEKRLAANEEGDFKDLMAKVESFNRSVQEAKQNVNPDLPDELKEYFSKNSWLYRAARFMGAKGWAGTKIAAPAIGKGMGKATAWSAKKGYNTIRSHPWGTAKVGLAGLSVATGYIPAALTLYLGWKGGKRLFGWGKGKTIPTSAPKTKEKPKTEPAQTDKGGEIDKK